MVHLEDAGPADAAVVRPRWLQALAGATPPHVVRPGAVAAVSADRAPECRRRRSPREPLRGRQVGVSSPDNRRGASRRGRGRRLCAGSSECTRQAGSRQGRRRGQPQQRGSRALVGGRQLRILRVGCSHHVGCRLGSRSSCIGPPHPLCRCCSHRSSRRHSRRRCRLVRVSLKLVSKPRHCGSMPSDIPRRDGARG